MTVRCTCGRYIKPPPKISTQEVAVAMSLDLVCEILRRKRDNFPAFLYREPRPNQPWWAYSV